jgi:hypothetical protein
MAKKDVKPQAKPAQTAPVGPPPQPVIAFDAWWASVQKRMPLQHHKEVVMADFKARGLSKQEPANVFNKALAQYGVKLK